MTDGIQQARMAGFIPPPKLEPSAVDPDPYGGLTRSQFLYNQEIRKLTEKAREKGWSGDYFLTRAKHLQDELGISEYEGAFIEATKKTGEQLSAMWEESPAGKIQTWWNSEPVPIRETRFAAPGKSYKELNPEWTVQSSLENRKNIRFAGQRFTGEQFLEAYGNDSRIMDYLDGSGGPQDLAIRLDAASAELENFATISDAGAAGWSGYFLTNMLLDPTNLLFTGAIVDIVNTARASKRMKKLLDTGQEISPDEARALHRSMTGQSRRGMLVKAATAGVGSVGVESYFDKKVTTGEVLLAGVTSMALAGLIGGIGAMRAKGVSELRGKAREYFDDIMAETTAGADDVPTRIRPDMRADEVQAVLTAEATKRMNRFVREGIEAGRPMEVVAEEAVRGLNSIQQLVGRVSSLTFSDGKTISDLQTSNANTVRTLYAILGNHRLSFKDADAQMIETISDLNAHRGMRITEISSLLRAESSRTGGNGMRGRFHGLVIRALEGRLDATPDEYFTKQKPGSKDPIQMDEMEVDLAKEKARRYADMIREDVFSEYEALAQGTGLRLPIENYFPRTGRVRSKVGEEGQELTREMVSFTKKYRSYLEDLVEKGEIQPIGDMDADLDTEVTRVVKAIQSGRTQKPGETTFDYRQTDDGQLVRETESPFMETVSETGEMQARTLAGPEGVDIPYDVTEDLYADAADHLMDSMRRHSATTNGAILSAVGAPKGQSLPEYRSTEQPFPTPRTPTHTDDLPITSHAEDATINIIPSAKAHKTDNPEKFIEETKPVVREVVEARKARVQNDEELASSNEQLAAKIDEVRTTRADLDERAKADIDRIANDLRIDSKNASRDLRDWEKSQNNLDRLETKEQTIRDGFDSLRTRTEQRLEELEAKQRKAEEEGFVPKQTAALELAEVSEKIHKLLVRDFKKRGKHSQRVFDRIGKTQKQIEILQAREILLEWKIRGRQYDPEDIGSVLRQERGLTKSVVDDAQKFLEEHDPKSKILQVFARKDMDPALKTVRSQLLKKNEELVKRNQEYKDLSPEGLTGKDAEELAKLNKRFDEINEFNRSLKGRTPKQYQRNLERMRQEKIDVLKRDLEEWGDPIKDGQLSDKFKVYAKDRVGKYESELEELGELGGDGEGGITHARKLEEEALRRADLSLDRLDSVESEQALNKWLRKNATAANKQEIQTIRDQVKESRLNRNEIRERRKEAGKREREANKVYRQTFDESPALGQDTSLGDVNGRIAALREEVSMRNMSMGIGRQDGKYVPLNHGYGKAINDEYADLIEDARARGKDGLAQKLEVQRDADFQKLGELRDHFLGQSGLDQSSDMVTWGSQFLTSANIAINSLADIAPTLVKSNADMFSGGEAVARSVVSVIRSTVQDALGYGASKNSLGQFFEALEIEGLRTTQASGRASSEASQGSIRLDTEEVTRTKGAIRNTAKEVWSWASLFRIVQPVVRGVAGRLHTTRALELGEKIFKGDVLSEGEQMYVRTMNMSNDELSSAYQNWVRSGGNESVTGSGLRSANTDEWEPLVGEKFKQGVGNHVERSSLKPRKEDRITTKKGGGVLSRLDANTRFWNNAFNALLSFPRTAFKEYGLKSIQSIAVARQAGDLASHYAMTRNTLTGGAILYGVFQLKKEMRSKMSPWYEEDDSTWGKIKDFGDFLSYTGLFGTILDIPRSGYYASRDFERAKRSVGAGVALGATAIRWVSPSLSGTAKVVGGMVELGETLYRGGINEDDVRKHLASYGFAPVPVRPSSILSPLFNALIEEGVEAELVDEVHRKIVP